MKYGLTLWVAFFIGSQAFGQEMLNKIRNESARTIRKDADTANWRWKRGGIFNANLSQGSLSNWAAGGDNFSLSVNSYFNYFLYYKKGRQNWDNNFDMNLGYVQTTSLGSRKNDDRFDILSKYGYKIDSTGKWFMSALFNFRSQYFDGYTFSNNIANFASSFLSPAYVFVSAGFDSKTSDKLSIFLSPLTARWTIVANNKLAAQGKYGVPKGQNVMQDIGLFATINHNNVIARNINYRGRLDLFSNYSNKPENIDVFMTNFFSFKINKYFSANYNLDLIYDDDVRLFGENKNSPGMQIKSMMGIGYTRPLNINKKMPNGSTKKEIR